MTSAGAVLCEPKINNAGISFAYFFTFFKFAFSSLLYFELAFLDRVLLHGGHCDNDGDDENTSKTGDGLSVYTLFRLQK